MRLTGRRRLALKLPLSGKKRLAPKTRPVRREYLPRTERFIRTKGLLPTENLLLHPMPRRNVHTEQRIWFHSAKRLVVHATKRFISVRDQGGVASLVRIPQAPGLRIGSATWYCKKLGLRTEQRHGGYMVAANEGSKLARLYEKYGVAAKTVDYADSVDFMAPNDTSQGKETPLI